MKTLAHRWDRLLDHVRGTLAADYDIARLIGAGGMASVYLARRRHDDGVVALKVMHPGLIAGAADTARFEREGRTMMRLHHPHIVRVHRALRHDGLHGLEMDYLPGDALLHVVARNRGGLECDVALHWLAQVGAAIAHAHANGIVHRDLTASNVLLDSAANAVVTDFGIAGVADATRLTELGFSIGTPAYMSPEQLADRPATPASDQYSFGVLAFELIAGRRPFHGPQQAVIDAHLTSSPPPLADLRPDVPRRVASAVMRMLEKEPASRHAGMIEALRALGAEPSASGDARLASGAGPTDLPC